MLTVRQQRITLKIGRVGLISDTHGLLRPQALSALKGSELIIHAGDIGNPKVLEDLRAIAPVVAIRGNNDRERWAQALPDVVNLQLGNLVFHVIHDVNDMGCDAGKSFNAVVSGHSHKPSIVRRDGALLINPGSAGPRRFKLPVAIGKLRIIKDKLQAQIVELVIGP